MTIDEIIDSVLRAEGGYSNDARDAGGETNFGITTAVARANGYAGAVKDMPREVARAIYRSRYVVAPGFDKVLALSPDIAAELVDTGVNMGPAIASRFLQRALNALGDEQLLVDGVVGSRAISALSAFVKKRGGEGERRLLALLNAEQGMRYLELTEARTANRTFLYGWLARIAA
ncbi:glycoside hydrolase family 108 protein [Sphingomonas sp.]|uniref:glycoside hydrolase family 108 protein n=1 Tax=Sphingomonas sp. TaxID=28214 RepID=UPI003B006093